MDLQLRGKVAVVAGGSRGCGRGIAEVLADEGALVLLSGRQKEAVSATVEAIRGAGGQAEGVVADMTDRADAERIIASARAAYGNPDILITNSPGSVPDPATNRWRG